MKTDMKRMIGFFLFSFLFTWFFWGLSILMSRNIINLPISQQLLNMIAPFGPSIVGLVFLIRYEKMKLRAIFTDTFLIKGKGIWKAYALLLMPIILGLSYLITRFIFGLDYHLEWFDAPLAIPIVFVYILFLGGPLGEEVGWRGYALKNMLKYLKPFYASLILGFVWSFWHLPAFFIEGSVQQGIPFYIYTLYTLFITLYITIVFIKTNYNIASALYFHTSANFALGIFFIIDEPLGLFFMSIFMVIALLYLLYKYRHIYFYTLSDGPSMGRQ